MKQALFLFFALAFMGFAASAQTSFWDGPSAYLGQTPPGDTPVKFAPSIINDTPFFSMDRCAFSPDGKEYYYVRNNTWFSSKNSSIQTLHFDGKTWVGPQKLTTFVYAPAFSKDGNTIYAIGMGRGVVSQMHRTDTGWSAPETYIKRGYGVYDFMPTNRGNMYAASNINGPVSDFTCYDICIMPPVGTDTTIKTLGKPINTPGFDGDFFIAPDETYMVLSAKEHPDYECELYISYHKPDGTWTNPKSLGAAINNGLAHRWGEYVTPNNKYLFYSYGHGPQDCAIYWVRFDNLLQSLRHTNFEPYVKDSIPSQTAQAEKPLLIKFDKGVFVDDDGNYTLTYTASLANGGPLPDWMKFDAKRKTIVAKACLAGNYAIKIIATDTAKATAVCTFGLKVQ